jgi:cell wall-associated NlpC family hydrolase
LALGLLTVPAVAPAAAAKKRVFGKRPLHQGMHGRDVRVLQDYLTKAGFETTVDGQFGRGTKKRVRAWESEAGRKVNGRVSRPDAKALRVTVESSSTRKALAAPTTGKAVVGPDGLAVAPTDAPPLVQAIIEAGNRIAKKPYRYGGGHGKWEDTGYDCSGSMSYAFHGAGMLDEALDSTGFESWGEPGKGTWVTIYAKGDHAYMIVAGLRFDTSGAKPSRWQTTKRSSSGFVVRHPSGL